MKYNIRLLDDIFFFFIFFFFVVMKSLVVIVFWGVCYDFFRPINHQWEKSRSNEAGVKSIDSLRWWTFGGWIKRAPAAAVEEEEEEEEYDSCIVVIGE